MIIWVFTYKQTRDARDFEETHLITAAKSKASCEHIAQAEVGYVVGGRAWIGFPYDIVRVHS